MSRFAFLRNALRSRRAHLAVTANAAVSVASLALSVTTARLSSVTEFGAFALTLVVYVFTTGIVRATCTDTALAVPGSRAVFVRSARRAILLLCGFAGAVITWGLIADNPYLTILGLTLHGLGLLDVARTYESAVGRASVNFALGGAWSLVVITAAITSFFVDIQPIVLFSVWGGTGAATGYVGMMLLRGPWLPGWERNASESRAGALFAGDYLVGSGGVALTTSLVGVLVSEVIVGALRGAGTILGPVGLLSSTARTLVIPSLARSQRNAFRFSVSATTLLVATCLPLLGLVQFIPESWGTWLLGETWAGASAVLLPLAIESLFVVIGSVPAAGHRAAFAGRRALALRVAVGVPRPFLVLGAAIGWGAIGAAWVMAAIAIMNAIAWWASYWRVTGSAADPASPSKL